MKTPAQSLFAFVCLSGDLPEENSRRSLQSSDVWFQRLLPALQVSSPLQQHYCHTDAAGLRGRSSFFPVAGVFGGGTTLFDVETKFT